jgi:putative glutathione S-transferase
MGKLVDGKWQDVWYETSQNKGHFIRKDASFRSWVTQDGAAGPSGVGGFAAERGRYHLYVSLACPWAHRTLIFRKLKGLEDFISLSVVNHFMGAQGWTFDAAPGVIADDVNGARLLHEVYQKADSTYTGRVTVPVLWDKARSTIVSNESSEIIRMFNAAFDNLGAKEGDYYPSALRAEIDTVSSRIYGTLNNGVYKCGFATTQQAYAAAFEALFDTMDWLEERLSGQRYLVGDKITEADWRLLTTLLRFDPVYVGHFKTNKRRLVDYPNLWAYTRELYQVPGVAETVDMHHIKHHYYASHTTINPSQVVPLGPMFDLDEPHGREHLRDSDKPNRETQQP